MDIRFEHYRSAQRYVPEVLVVSPGAYANAPLLDRPGTRAWYEGEGHGQGGLSWSSAKHLEMQGMAMTQQAIVALQPYPFVVSLHLWEGDKHYETVYTRKGRVKEVVRTPKIAFRFSCGEVVWIKSGRYVGGALAVFEAYLSARLHWAVFERYRGSDPQVLAYKSQAILEGAQGG